VAVASGAASLFVPRPWPALNGSVAFAAAFNGILRHGVGLFRADQYAALYHAPLTPP
jgi:hypothetical protein